MFSNLLTFLHEEIDYSSIDDVLEEWKSKKRSMGCVAATDWFVKRVSGFHPVRLNRYTKSGELYQHVVASDGRIIIDLAPYADQPREYDSEVDGEIEPELNQE